MTNKTTLRCSECEQKNKTIAFLYERKRDCDIVMAKQNEHIKKLCHEAGHPLSRAGDTQYCTTCSATLGWSCDTSPIKVCQYNVDEDPACDSCIWCGDPEERK